MYEKSITYTCFSIAENQINVQQKETVTCWVSKLMWAFAVIMPCIISLCTLYCELLLIYSSNTNAKDCAYILVICSESKKELNEYIYKNLLLLIFVLLFCVHLQSSAVEARNVKYIIHTKTQRLVMIAFILGIRSKYNTYENSTNTFTRNPLYCYLPN